MDKRICQTFFNLGILFITGCTGDIIQFPENAAVGDGGTAVFNCTSNNIAVVAWYLSRDGTVSGSSSEKITNYCNVQPGYSSHYKTEPLGGAQPTCNLIVLNATLLQAGVYLCSDGQLDKENARALMTVVDSLPSVIANQPDVVVGETLKVSCTIGYNGSISPAPLLPPSIYWTSSTGENISSSLSPTPPPNSVESNILVKPDRSSNSIGPFICHGYFGHPQNPANSSLNYATNAPTTTYSTTSSVFNVYYEPKNVTITGSDCNGSVCYCNDGWTMLSGNSEGNPMPSYMWSNVEDQRCFQTITSQTINATFNGTYQCTAENEIRGTKYRTSANVTVQRCASLETRICGGEGGGDDTSKCGWQCGLIIGIVSYVSLNILAMIVFLLYYGLGETGHRRLNDRFEKMEKMLPCMNKGRDCSGWVCLFVFISIFAGIIYFPTIVIMANCQKNKKTSQDTNMQLNERNESGRENKQKNSSGTKPSKNSSRNPASNASPPTPPPPLETSVHSHQDPRSRAYHQSNTPQRLPTHSGMAGPYLQDPRNQGHRLQSPSPDLSTGGIIYAELRADNQPRSRKPVQPFQTDATTYAPIGMA